MTSSASTFYVFVYLDGQARAVPSGRLQMLEQGSTVLNSVFRYGDRYAERRHAIALDPFALALLGTQVQAERYPIDANGLAMADFGVFRDAAPDNWGRRVIENKLRKLGPLPESDYIRHAGSNRTGALDFRGEITSIESDGRLAGVMDLEYLQDAAHRVDAGLDVPASLALIFQAGVSMGGARPKAVVEADGRQWLAKFSMDTDRYNVSAIEHATLRLAARAGLSVPETRLVDLGGNKTAMLIERFDRVPMSSGYARRHFISGLTMLRTHESESPHQSYMALSNAIAMHGVSGQIGQDQAELFARMVFNILVSNNDDHLRNHGFIYDAATQCWRLSPLYDVLPMPSLATERQLHLGVGLSGRLATLPNAMSAHRAFGLTYAAALAIIDRVCGVVREWRVHFSEFGVSEEDMVKIAPAMRHPRDVGRDTLTILRSSL